MYTAYLTLQAGQSELFKQRGSANPNLHIEALLHLGVGHHDGVERGDRPEHEVPPCKRAPGASDPPNPSPQHKRSPTLQKLREPDTQARDGESAEAKQLTVLSQ